MPRGLFECVINISEGQREALLSHFDQLAGASLRDRHSDGFHNRSVFTLINNPEALVRDVRALLRAVYNELDLVGHQGVHPRFGVADVVPFVALDPAEAAVAVTLRDQVAEEMAQSEGVSVFLYGPLSGGHFRTLPEVRRYAFKELAPEFGPATPNLHKGASAYGARPLLVAWNLWISGIDLSLGRQIATAVRTSEVRTLAFRVGDEIQISCNFIAPLEVTPEFAYDQVASLLPINASIIKSEQVGLAPQGMLDRIPAEKWKMLGLSPSTSIESRL
jgi:glutamate formiminotransferase / 5-formyltetrahydrofolate cyclo-ligase